MTKFKSLALVSSIALLSSMGPAAAVLCEGGAYSVTCASGGTATGCNTSGGGTANNCGGSWHAVKIQQPTNAETSINLQKTKTKSNNANE